jgi:hypothetical protein
MSNYDEVNSELYGKTGTDPEVEKELIRRIAIIEEQGNVVPPLTKNDWILTLILFVVVGLGPVFYEAIKLGVQ